MFKRALPVVLMAFILCACEKQPAQTQPAGQPRILRVGMSWKEAEAWAKAVGGKETEMDVAPPGPGYVVRCYALSPQTVVTVCRRPKDPEPCVTSLELCTDADKPKATRDWRGVKGIEFKDGKCVELP